MEKKSGRPNNKPINRQDLMAIMKIFEDKFFNNKNNTRLDKSIDEFDYPKKASYIAELASGFHLDEKQMKVNLFIPYGEGEVVKLSKQYVRRICAFLKAKAVDFGFQDAIGSIEAFEAAHINRNTGSVAGPRLSDGSLKKKIKNLLKMNNWYIYERIGKAHNNAGIAIGKVVFDFSESGELKASMTFMYGDIHRIYEGKVEFDDKPEYIYMHLFLKDSMKQAFVALTLSAVDNMCQTISLGHFTYYSKEYRHLLTKAVVLQKVNSNNENQVIGNYDFDSKEYNAIDVEITRFLYPRLKNRLSLPKDIISNEVELGEFIKKKANKINTVLQNFNGEFNVYYKNAQEDILEDGLSIGLNANLSIIEANYIHRPDVFQGNDKTWRGQVYYNKNSVIVELSETGNDLDVPQDPLLLTFYIPGKILRDSETDCFPGLLTGLQDTEKKAPVSYICLAVRKDVTDFKGLDDDRLVHFFPKTEKTMLTPPSFPFRIAKL